MLVLTRKAQQRIKIGDDITISIIKVRGNSVSVGIEAPGEVRILRAELPLFDAEVEAGDESGEASAPRDAGPPSGTGLKDLVHARCSRLRGCAPLPV